MDYLKLATLRSKTTQIDAGERERRERGEKKNEQREKSIPIRRRDTIPRNPRDSHAENGKACTYANKKDGIEMKSQW